ncbi:MAG: hypothetical protein LQ349_003338 [Xanthoria aureola]|nr:MAG: hypothetical protein LQ349_003338 [Xanthoria aureola]
MVVLTPQNSGTCHDKSVVSGGKNREEGGRGELATYLPGRKPVSHTLDDVLRVSGNDPCGVFIRIPHPELRILAPLPALALAPAIPPAGWSSVRRDRHPHPQEEKPCAKSSSPQAKSDTSGRADIAVLTAGAIGEDDAVMVAYFALGPAAIIAEPFVARAAIEDELTAVLAGSDQVVGVFPLEEGAENPFPVDAALGVLAHRKGVSNKGGFDRSEKWSFWGT